MGRSAGGSVVDVIWTRKSALLAGVGAAALLMAIASPALAATYYVSTAGQLRDSITAANADGDPSSTIVMTTNFGVDAVGLPGATKPLTIDTNGFTLSTAGNNSIVLQSGAGPTTLEGTITAVGFAANSAGGLISIRGISSVVNNAIIQAGSSSVGLGAAGVDLGGPPGGPATLVNNGTIRGGNGSTTGGIGLFVRANTNPIINTGTIEGGNGAFAIRTNGATTNLNLINSGTIRAGVGQASAIELAAGSNGTITLELRAGSVIEGNVVANAAQATDTLRLGGSGDDSFDVSDIGAAAQFRNFNIFEKTGASAWTITGVAPEANPWDILAGTLFLAAGSDLGNGALDVQGGMLAGFGTVGDTTLAAAAAISPGGNGAIGTLTIDGDFTGNGGTILIDTTLGGDGSPTDLLRIAGNTSGTGVIDVTNLGGAGGATVDGIRIIDVEGLNSDASFTLLGDTIVDGQQAVVAGVYYYGLYQGSVSDAADGDWYLRNLTTADGRPIFQPAVPVYEAYAGVLQTFNRLGTLEQRVGNRQWADGAEAGTFGLWGRMDGSTSSITPETSTSGASYDVDTWRLEAGIDGALTEGEAGRVVFGLNARYSTLSADIASPSGNGTIEGTGYGLGGTLTFYGASGFYLDGQASVNWYASTLSSATLGELASGNAGIGYGLSLEAGQKVGLGENFSITPQVQLSYSAVEFDDFTDGYGTTVALTEGDSLVARLGVSADYESAWQSESGEAGHTRLYGIANLYYELLDGTETDVAGTALVSAADPLWGGVGLGGSIDWGGASIYGESWVKTSLGEFGDSYSLGATGGLRVQW